MKWSPKAQPNPKTCKGHRETIEQPQAPSKPLSMGKENFLTSYLKEAVRRGKQRPPPEVFTCFSAHLFLTVELVHKDHSPSPVPSYPEANATFKHRFWVLSSLGHDQSNDHHSANPFRK